MLRAVLNWWSWVPNFTITLGGAEKKPQRQMQKAKQLINFGRGNGAKENGK
jgi:hypothetical protein